MSRFVIAELLVNQLKRDLLHYPSLSSKSSPFLHQKRPYSWKNFTLEDELSLEIRQSIEKKWATRVYGKHCPAENNKINKPDKFPGKYILSMFPYPSGRLHLGHVRVYTLSDVLARFHRMQGYEVVHPIGWDAFGLPAENAARNHGIDAEIWTRENIVFMKKQLLSLGGCFDWDREFATCDASYYKWTQWIFIKLWENGLAYKKLAYVYWDPVDETVLAEEQVDSEMCSWRSGAKVEKKLLNQWFIKTTVFAEKLMAGLNSGKLKHGWRDVTDLQKHWIGTISGHFTDCLVNLGGLGLHFENSSNDSVVKEPIRLWFSSIEKLKDAKYFILRSDHFLSQFDQCIYKKYSNGLKLMTFSISNPVTGENMPVFSGIDGSLPYVPTSCEIRTDEILSEDVFKDKTENETVIGEINSILEDLLTSETASLVPISLPVKSALEYHPASLTLRDWLVSRQRKWGTPIPSKKCKICGEISVVLEEDLPFDKSSTEENLQSCFSCGSKDFAIETDTLDTFFDSAWYFLRFLDSDNKNSIFDPQKVEKFFPVNIYVGGKEHATLHLYYARFITHFLHQLGLVSAQEPIQKLIPIGMVLGEAYIVKSSGRYLKDDEYVKDGQEVTQKDTNEIVVQKWEKMSKSKYNGIDPENVIQQYGIDLTRLLTMCEAAPTTPRKWPPNNTQAFIKWQSKIWHLLRVFVDVKDFGDTVFIDEEIWNKSEAELFDTRNHYLKGINNDYAVTSQINIAIGKLQALFGSLKKVPKHYLKESIEFERALGTAIICLYPIMPAFSSQIWQSFRAVANLSEPEFDLDNEVWEQRWPTVDWRYKLDLICKYKNEEVVAKVERNYLDTLDQYTALEIAFDQPEVQKLIARDSCEVAWFVVEPGFRATLKIRKKEAV